MNWRKTHRYVALFASIPLLMIAITGIMLQLRNQFEWVQPKTISSSIDVDTPLLTYEKIMASVGPERIEQIIFRPQKSNLTVRLKDGMELQLHPQTGTVLKQAQRRTSFLIELHQGSWLGFFGQYFIHFLTGISLIFLIISGIKIYTFARRRL